MPNVIIIAGPNGAGKTTFADEYLSNKHIEFVNADEIARATESRSDVSAARRMLVRIDELVQRNADFALETTLATLTYAQKIPGWRKKGYVVRWRICVWVQSRNRSVEFVGEWPPADTASRRKGKSLKYFETVYKPLVDEWYVWESREGAFALVESG